MVQCRSVRKMWIVLAFLYFGYYEANAIEATTAAKPLEFSGWRPIMKPEALNTSEFAQRISTSYNATDSSSLETRRSFILVYPPRTSNGQIEPQNSRIQQQNPARDVGPPPARTYPTQSRYQRMMHFGAQSRGDKRHSSNPLRPEFPPVANPPPLPEHALKQREQVPKFKPESTSRHQVQVQLLDGYFVPPPTGLVSDVGKDKRPEITAFPLNLNDVPEIRLLLPGDVHAQLNNLHQNVAQTNPQIPHQNYAAQNKQHNERPNQYIRHQNNAGSKTNGNVFESQRQHSNSQKTDKNIANKNYDDSRPQQNQPINQNYNRNQHQGGFSQPDPVPYPDRIMFPGPNIANFNQPQDNTNFNNVANQGHAGGNTGIYQKEQKLDARAPVNPEAQNYQNIHGQRQIQNTNGHINGNVKQNSFPNQNQGNYRGESFHPLPNANGNVQIRNPGNQNYNQQVHGQSQSNFQGYAFQNGGQAIERQNGWRIKQSNVGKQNYNRVLVPPEKQNFYSIQNNDQQSGIQNTQTTFNHVGNENINQNQNAGRTKKNEITSVQEKLDQQKLTDDDSFFSSRPSVAQQGSKTGEFSQEKLNDKKDSSVFDNSGEQVYFIPPVLSQDDVQKKVQAFDQTTGDSSASTDANPTRNIGADNSGIIQQQEIEQTEIDVGVGAMSSGRQPAATIDRMGFCDCSTNCAPIQRSPNENFGSTIREIARSLNAEAFFEFVGLSDEEIEDLLSADGAYTLFIPSNEAVSRLPSNLIDHWRDNRPDLTLALLNHVVQDAVTLDQLKLGGRMSSRANDATLFINNYNNEAVTVNGHRIVYGDVTGPKGGTIHVIDGTLCPVADRDIINTLRTCNKYDGFLTLADVTKMLDTMQDEGPYTVFLPSNEALTKIPAEELSVLKENVTVLREFLEYHIVQGAYFSGDIKDGQYLTTLHQKEPLRVGVRVDGCYRRLVEANNSPIFKADIPTKNGVIHVIDWVLRPGDLHWCEGVILP